MVCCGRRCSLRASFHRPECRWYQETLRQKVGRITAAGVTSNVTFEPADGPINDRIDDAYRAKYTGSPYLDLMIGAPTRWPTLRVILK